MFEILTKPYQEVFMIPDKQTGEVKRVTRRVVCVLETRSSDSVRVTLEKVTPDYELPVGMYTSLYYDKYARILGGVHCDK